MHHRAPSRGEVDHNPRVRAVGPSLASGRPLDAGIEAKDAPRNSEAVYNQAFVVKGPPK
jgi:hypothetical protein